MNKKEMTLTAYDLNRISDIAEEVIHFNLNARVFCFYGQMGAGKTTLIKAICEKLNVVDNVASPTFSIINEYITKDNMSVFHFDFYRIKNLNEVYDIGYEDYLFSGKYCFIEWPELIQDILPNNFVKVDIEVGLNGDRNIVLAEI